MLATIDEKNMKYYGRSSNNIDGRTWSSFRKGKYQGHCYVNDALICFHSAVMCDHLIDQHILFILVGL